jgi:hypothetical protein
MTACCAYEYAFCRSPNVSEQRWVREKIYDLALNGRDPRYHRYHAELFAGQEESCWEKHQMEEEIARITPALLTGQSEQLKDKHVLVDCWNCFSPQVAKHGSAGLRRRVQ